MLSHGTMCTMGKLLIVFNSFGKTHDTTKISATIALGNVGNHFVVKCLLKSSITSFLLIARYIELV